jgi:hypothetical protein
LRTAIEFVIGETVGFEQNMIRHTDFPDVVQGSSEHDHLGLVIGKAQLHGDSTDVLRNPLAMTAGVAIPQVDQRNQRCRHCQCLALEPVLQFGDPIMCLLR